MALACHACGQVNDDQARFCSACGAGLHHADEATGLIPVGGENDTIEMPAIAAAELPSGSGILVVLRGSLEGVRFSFIGPVGTEYTLGRSADNDIFLDDVTVSRRHAIVNRTDQGWEISDSGSLNGTYVNRNRVESAVLVDNDEVQIGKFRFAFLVSP